MHTAEGPSYSMLTAHNLTVYNGIFNQYIAREFTEKLRDDVVSEAIVNSESNTFEKVEDHDLDMKLRELPYGIGTRFNPDKRCLPQTRVKFLDAIIDWVNNPDSKVLILFGQAGTGKSSIAHEVAHWYNEMNCLTTSYFFVRGNPSGREPYRFFTTLARDLCRISPVFKAALGRILNDNPHLAHVHTYTTLIESLLLDPLKDLYFTSPVLIIIDALDENEDAAHKQLYAGGNIIPFHTALSQCLSKSPSNFRILITSRPEAELEKAFPESSIVRHMHMTDPQLADEVDNDIFIYTREKLFGACVDENCLWKLAKKAEGLFQWAFVACDYISHPPPGLNAEYCLEEILHSSQTNGATEHLDNLYSAVLKAHFNMERRQISDNFRSVMGQVLGTFQPLSITSLNTMRQHAADGSAKNTNISDVVRYIGSLLSNVTPYDSILPITPFHTSVRDFLTDSERSNKFYVDLNAAHKELAYATLRTMQAMLRFNICQLETSYRLNEEVPDLSDRIKKHIPSALSYSCRFWSEHLTHVSEFNAELFKCIEAFMERKFLFWLEVLSLKGEMAAATTALLRLRTWLGQMQRNVHNDGIHTLHTLVEDATSFVQYFGYPMAQSTPHIYLSALPFAPSSSKIANLYSPWFPCTLDVKRGRLPQWPALVMAMSVPERSPIVCVAWSGNGEYVAAGLFDGNVCVWNASTGTRVSEPLAAGGTGTYIWDHVFASSVALSHDGGCLASGLSDGRIKIWELTTRTGQVERKSTLKGHIGAVSALSFSQDGKLLVSGSEHCNILIWDVDKEEALAGPFCGHKNPVWAVSFLPDQEHILSRSGFRTVRVWNMKTGRNVMKQFELENMEISTGTIDSVVCVHGSLGDYPSRSKSGFASCSWTEAVECEEEEYKPEERHGYWVQTASFSYDGKFVVTSNPKCSHVWHANGRSAGKLAGGPFNHDQVTCLAFSADGQQILSGSLDGTVREWNVGIVDDDSDATATVKEAAPYPVAFTPDGKEIVLEQDGLFQVLDVSTGQELVKFREERWKDSLRTVSLNGDLIASTWGCELWIKTRTGDPVTGPLRTIDNEVICAVTFSPNVNDLVAFGTDKGTVFVFNASTGIPIAGPKQICDGRVTSLELSPSTTNGAMSMTRTFVAVVSYESVSIWHIHSGHLAGPFKRHQELFSTLMFSSDASHITSVNGGHILCVWDSTTGDIVRGPVGLSDEQKAYAEEPCWSIALTQYGRRMAFIGKHDTILVFEVVYNGDSGISLQGPLVLGGNARQLLFSTDGQLLATTTYDRTVMVWDVQAAADHKQFVIDSASASDNAGVFNFNEAFIDDNGWATCPHSRGGSPLRLMWIPEMHRKSLRRPCCVCVMGYDRRKETLLHLEKFVHGKDWVNCKAQTIGFKIQIP